MFESGKINLHTHTYYCRHGSGNVADYMFWAQKENVKILAFSEHVPLPDELLLRTRMRIETLPYLWQEMTEASAEYPEIRLLRALEGEYIPELINYQKELKEVHKLDFMIASNHYIWLDGHNNQFPEVTDKSALKIIAEQSIALIESGLGIFFAHPDLFFAYGMPWSAESKAVSKDIIECAKAHKMPLEINAYGLRKVMIVDADGIERRRYPKREFWELAAEIGGVEVVCNSDAHTPSAIWRAVPENIAWAAELGLPVVNERLAKEILSK